MINIPSAPTHAIYAIDNWDGEGDTYHVLAFKHGGQFYSYENCKPILQYVGDKILQMWPLEAAPAVESEPVGYVHKDDVSKFELEDSHVIMWATLYKHSAGNFDVPVYLHPQPSLAEKISPELHARVLALCDQIDSYTHTWALQTDAKAIREMLESGK
jgi:hypothetical protein